MTYCVGLCLEEGLVFLADTRTNAGVDQLEHLGKWLYSKKRAIVFFRS